MTALVLLAPSFSPMFSLIGLAVIIAAAVLAAHWGAYRPQAKRMIAASLIALCLATVAVRAEDEDLITKPIDWCWVYTLNPDNWYAWMMCVVQIP